MPAAAERHRWSCFQPFWGTECSSILQEAGLRQACCKGVREEESCSSTGVFKSLPEPLRKWQSPALPEVRRRCSSWVLSPVLSDIQGTGLGPWLLVPWVQYSSETKGAISILLVTPAACSQAWAQRTRFLVAEESISIVWNETPNNRAKAKL